MRSKFSTFRWTETQEHVHKYLSMNSVFPFLRSRLPWRMLTATVWSVTHDDSSTRQLWTVNCYFSWASKLPFSRTEVTHSFRLKIGPQSATCNIQQSGLQEKRETQTRNEPSARELQKAVRWDFIKSVGKFITVSISETVMLPLELCRRSRPPSPLEREERYNQAEGLNKMRRCALGGTLWGWRINFGVTFIALTNDHVDDDPNHCHQHQASNHYSGDLTSGQRAADGHWT